ncbi:hypothetical protein P8605_49380, partial [Streptomyces sp. T-3]|nr:hypothetical protein [Streptomyces sp. T-3]
MRGRALHGQDHQGGARREDEREQRQQAASALTSGWSAAVWCVAGRQGEAAGSVCAARRACVGEMAGIGLRARGEREREAAASALLSAWGAAVR